MFAPLTVRKRGDAARRPAADWGYLVTSDGRVRLVERHGARVVASDGETFPPEAAHAGRDGESSVRESI